MLFLTIQECYWKQKAGDDAIQLGDKNSRYFFHKANRHFRNVQLSSHDRRGRESCDGVENLANYFTSGRSKTLNVVKSADTQDGAYYLD